MATVTSSKRHLLVTSDTYTSNGDVVVGGDLTVSGSTTTLDTQNLIVEDKNIIIGQVATPTDTTADGGGITLKGASDYTIAWNDSRNAWLFNQHLQPASDFSHDLGGTSYRWNAIYGGAGVFANSLTIGGNTAVTRTGVGHTGRLPVFSSNDNLVASRIFQSSTGTYIHDSDNTTPLQITKGGSTFVKFVGLSVINNSYIEVSPGTESTPGINFGRRNGTNANDTNTGIYSSAGDHIDIATGGSRRIGWDSAGTSLYTLSAATTDTDKFLVSDSGLIKYRTGSQIRSDIGAQASGSYETDDGSDDRYVFKVDLSNLSNVTRWYKVATVNLGSGGLLMRGSLTNHVESFGSTKFDLTIQGRENNANDQVEINGSIDVFDDNTGVYIVKSTLLGSYTSYDVYIQCYNYTQAWVELIKTGQTTFDTSGNYVTTAPSGLVELDTSNYNEGSYTIIDSENRFSIRKISANVTQISGNAPSSAVLRIGAGNNNQIYMDGSTVTINDDMETERIYINTCDTNTTSTTALVLNGTEVEKRTLGSAAFAAVSDFAASNHSHSEYLRSNANDTATGDLIFNGDVTFGGTSSNPKEVIIAQIVADNSENTSLMLDGNGVVKTRNLGSAAFANTGDFLQQGSYSAGYTGDMNSLTGFRLIRSTSGTNRAFAGHHNVITIPNTSSSQYGAQMAFETGTVSDGGIKFRNSTNGTFTSWYRLYHEGHKPTYSELGTMAYSNLTGAPSSLPANGGNADTVDTLHADSFLRSDANDTGTGIITLSQNSSSVPYPLIVKNVSNGNGVGIEFDDNLNGSQRGYIKHFHSDTKSYGSGASMIISSSEATTTILADGKLMYGEGIYSKPGSGTGAGTRKDQNWDTAYTHSQSAHAPSNAEQNVQANWNESSSSSDAFIQNKPTIPSGSQLVKLYNNVDYIASGGTSGTYRDNYGPGLTVYEGYSTGANRPHTYDTTLQVMSTGSQGFEISADWVSNTNTPLKVRSLRDCCQGWNPWTTIWTENNFSQTNINNWNTAYNNHITGIAVTGTSTKTITLTQQDGGTISANFTDQSGSAATEFSYTIDMSNTSTYAETTYYPVTIPISQAKIYKFKIENALNTNVPGWSTHGSGFSLLLEFTTHGNGWGTHYQNRYVSLWSERYANVTILGGITQMTNSSNEVLWLRGGGRYNLKSNVSGLTVTPRSSTYTASSQSVSPQTSVVNDVYSSADGIFAVDSLKAISQFVSGNSFLTTLNVSGNSYLGDGNGDQTIINDTLYVGANDSGDSHFYFGEDSSGWYGEHWYWDSGHETERYSRHAGTDTLIEKHDTRYTHKIQTNRGYERLAHSTGYQIGSYNSVGANSAKTNPIYVIGDNYRPTDTSIAGMYGVGYAHNNLWGSGKSDGWGFYVAENGSFTQTLTPGGLWSAGTITSANQGTLWGSSNDGPNSGLNADLLDGNHASAFATSGHNHDSRYLRKDTDETYSRKRFNFGASTNWDAVGFGNQTNVHMQGHNQFWVGAGNGTWFEGTANTKSSTSGLAADASNAHDLLISTMQATAATDRGITFAVDSTGAGNDGWRLGKWHSSNSQASSKLTIDGGLHVRGGDMANYDYYADDYSTYWDNQSGGAYWTGDTGWIDPSITAGNAIQIQAGNAATNSNNPALQFHQYGYGGVQFRYDGPSDVMHLESTGTDRYDYFQNKTDHGYIQIGPMNTSHAHIYTDRSNFYFNKEIRVLGGCTVKQTEFSLGSGHKVIWNNGYGNPYIQDYYGSININAPVYIGASGNATNNLYAAGLYVNNNTVWHAGSTGLGGQNRISDLSNANNSVPSGFYQASSGTNYPTTGTWYNLLNVRHSNTANDHGFQIAASYYNEDIFTRTYQGGSGANNGTYTTWRRLFHEGHQPTWSEIASKPSTFTPSSHNHAASEITSGTFATARIPNLDASKITSGTFSNRFSTGTRYSIGLTDGSTSQTRDKLRVWSGGTYTIGMKSGFTYGHLGDYAMTFQMNSDDDRGWWWGDTSHSDAQGAMSLTTNGRLVIATSLSVGQGESVTSPSTEALYVSGSADISTNVTARGHFYGRSVNGAYSNIYRMGGIYFTWDSDSYGTNNHHSIRSTYGDSYGDDLTINSYHHLRINIDSNNNNSDEKFEIGQNTTGTGNVRFRVLGTGAVYAANDIIAYYSFSDERLKTDIKPTTNNLDKVLKLEPVEYSWKDGSRDGKKEIGLIAQDVEKVVPEVVRENTRLSDDDDTLYKQVDYEHLVSTLIGAVQEQQDQIELLKAEIEELKNK